jgi:hypothetical protein
MIEFQASGGDRRGKANARRHGIGNEEGSQRQTWYIATAAAIVGRKTFGSFAEQVHSVVHVRDVWEHVVESTADLISALDVVFVGYRQVAGSVERYGSRNFRVGMLLEPICGRTENAAVRTFQKLLSVHQVHGSRPDGTINHAFSLVERDGPELHLIRGVSCLSGKSTPK